MRARLPGFALGCAAAFIAVLLLEAAIHLVEPWSGPLFSTEPANPLLRHHPLLAIEHVPNAVYRAAASRTEYRQGSKDLRTNNLGLRNDQDTRIEKPAGVYRILVLGDSQTDGYVANSDTWSSVLARVLNQAPGADAKTVEVLNAGVVTYGPMNEYLWWRLYGRRLQPDLVILGYYLGNDLVDAGLGRVLRRSDGTWELDDTPRPPPEQALRRRLLQSCRLCALIRASLSDELISGALTQVGLMTPEEWVIRHYGGCIWDSLQQTRLLVGNPAKYQAELADTNDILQRLNSEVAAAGAKLAVIFLPSKIQIEDDSEARLVADALHMRLPEEPLEDQVQKDVTTVCRNLGIPTADPRPEFEEVYSQLKQPLYYPADWHLNILGNRTLGESRALRKLVRGEES